MNLYESFKSSENLENKGIWVSFGENTAFCIRRSGGSNKEYNKALSDISKKYQTEIRIGALDEQIASDVMIDVFCKHVLIDWKGVKNEKGDDLDFNTANAKKLLKDLPEVHNILSEKASNFKNFQEEKIAEIKKP